MTNYTTTMERDSLIRMFIDGAAEEVYANGRLATVPTENGVQLVAYGNEILAENQGGDITIYTGHFESVSETVTRYIQRLGSILSTGTSTRSVTARDGAAPTMGIGARASESAKYIDAYVGMWESLSPVDKKAKREVDAAVNRRMNQIFG